MRACLEHRPRKGLVLFWTALLCAGCAVPDGPVRSGLEPRPSAPSDPHRVSTSAPRLPTLAILEPAARYRGPSLGAPADEDLRWVLREANRVLVNKGQTLGWDGRLVAAARSLLTLPRLEGITGAALVFALQGAGVVEPSGRLLADLIARETGQTWRARVLARLLQVVTEGGYTLLGGALEPEVRGPGRRIALVLLRSHLRLSSVPRRASEDSSILLRGTLGPGYGAARVMITAPDGASSAPRLASATDGTFHAVVPLAGGTGRYQVEVLGSGPGGPEVLANFPLFVGHSPPDRILVDASAVAEASDPRTAARTLWSLLGQARRQAGRPALLWLPTLAKVARAHAFSMCRRQEVLHHSSESGAAADRVAHAGLRVTWVGENVGRAATVAEADRAMMQSPGHRATRLQGGATHGGVGVCVIRRRGGQDVYVTELFVRMGEAR